MPVIETFAPGRLGGQPEGPGELAAQQGQRGNLVRLGEETLGHLPARLSWALNRRQLISNLAHDVVQCEPGLLRRLFRFALTV